jgi:hypothetical protein
MAGADRCLMSWKTTKLLWLFAEKKKRGIIKTALFIKKIPEEL